MKAKHQTVSVIVMLLGCHLLGIVLGQPQTRAQPEQPDLQSQSSSLGAALFTLAAERFALAAKRGAPPILAVHEATENPKILKYADKDRILISVPVLAEDRFGMCHFVSHYNSFHVRATDWKVKSGKYKEAREMYQLLLHVASCENSRKEIDRRLKALGRLERGELSAKEADQLFSEYETMGAIPDLAQIESLKATTITNLLEVDLPR